MKNIVNLLRVSSIIVTRKNSLLLLASTAICLFSALGTPAQESEHLIFAVDVIRHGDRGPVADLPSAPHKWPQGIGELTPEGMNQEFQLGKQFRERYIEKNHLLPETFDVETMYVRSSDLDRTLMSAECALLGLYPLGTGPLTEKASEGAPARYQPIPIHTQPRDTDDVLIPNANKTLNETYKKYVYESADWQARVAKERPSFQRWSRLTGTTITELQQMSGIGDTVHVRQIHHVAMPEGMTEADAESMMNAGEWVFAQTFKPAEVGHVAGGKLLKLIDNYFIDATKANSKLKYVLFSAHDSTISSLMSAMKAPADVRPHYSSDLNITLWQNGATYTVKAALNGQPVNFPGATDGSATLAKFEELATP